MPIPFFVGCYGSNSRDNIHAFCLDDGIGRLSPMYSSGKVSNPSYLLCKGDILYSVSECSTEETSGVCVWKRKDDGLTLLQEVRFPEGAACHLMLCPAFDRLFAACYDTGCDVIFAIREDGMLEEPYSVVRHRGCSPNHPRQQVPHAHANIMTTNPYRMVSVDLGADTVTVNNISPAGCETHLRECSRLTLPNGSGPRHMVFSSLELAYLVTELSNKVYKLDFHAGSGSLWNMAEVSTLPAGFTGNSTAAAIKLSPDEKILAVSNRGHDSVTLFRVGSDGSLMDGMYSSAEGACPRDLAFSPDGNYMVVCCQQSDCVNLFRIDRDSLSLTLCDRISLPSPACVTFDIL